MIPIAAMPAIASPAERLMGIFMRGAPDGGRGVRGNQRHARLRVACRQGRSVVDRPRSIREIACLTSRVSRAPCPGMPHFKLNGARVVARAPSERSETRLELSG